MALIECYECNKQISDMANACPNCGAPIKSAKSSNKVFIENATKGKGIILLGYTFVFTAALYLWGGLDKFFMISLIIGFILIVIGEIKNWYYWK